MTKGIEKGIITYLARSFPRPQTLTAIANNAKDGQGQRMKSVAAVDYYLNGKRASDLHEKGDLLSRGIVVRKPDGFVLRSLQDSLNDGRPWEPFDLMVEFFLPNDGNPDQSLVDFLLSPYANEQVFIGMSVNALISAAHVMWLRSVNPDVLELLADEIGQSKEPMARAASLILHELARGFRTNDSSEEIYLRIKEKHLSLKPNERDWARDMCVPWLKRKEWNTLKVALRFCPSLIRLVVKADSQGFPFVDFKVPTSLNCMPKKKAAKTAYDWYVRTTKGFWRHLVESYVTTDRMKYKILSDPKLMTKEAQEALRIWGPKISNR
jgi:hypothetical protein